MIIGITGLKRSGKDTAGDFLQDVHGFERISFAGPLKRVCVQFLNCAGIEEDQREEEREFLILHKNLSKAAGELGIHPSLFYEFQERFFDVFSPYLIVMDDTYSKYNVSYRKILQLFGTDVCRYFKDYLWIEMAEKKMQDCIDLGKNVVITDVRFDNEAEAIKSLGGKVLRVVRDGCKEDGHSSERGVNDRWIDNKIHNTTFEELYSQLEVACQL